MRPPWMARLAARVIPRHLILSLMHPTTIRRHFVGMTARARRIGHLGEPCRRLDTVGGPTMAGQAIAASAVHSAFEHTGSFRVAALARSRARGGRLHFHSMNRGAMTALAGGRCFATGMSAGGHSLRLRAMALFTTPRGGLSRRRNGMRMRPVARVAVHPTMRMGGILAVGLVGVTAPATRIGRLVHGDAM
jgi:hypothetical protein